MLYKLSIKCKILTVIQIKSQLPKSETISLRCKNASSEQWVGMKPVSSSELSKFALYFCEEKHIDNQTVFKVFFPHVKYKHLTLISYGPLHVLRDTWKSTWTSHAVNWEESRKKKEFACLRIAVCACASVSVFDIHQEKIPERKWEREIGNGT